MILDTKNISVAYRCPKCGKGVVSMVGVFTLSGDVFKLKCECGGSELLIARADYDSFRFTVPCFICPNPHHFKISKSALFSKDLFSFGCSYTGFDICFIGEHRKVLDALDESAKTLEGIIADAGVDDLEMLRAGRGADLDADDPIIDEIIRFTLADMNDTGDIRCGCGEGDEPLYNYEFVPPDYTDLRVFCATCGCEKIIPMTSVVNAQAFLEADELVLTPPDETEDG